MGIFPACSQCCNENSKNTFEKNIDPQDLNYSTPCGDVGLDPKFENDDFQVKSTPGSRFKVLSQI